MEQCVPEPEDLRGLADATTQFRDAVRDMLALPVERTEAQDMAIRRMLAEHLKAVFPVEDAGSFASLLSRLDHLSAS